MKKVILRLSSVNDSKVAGRALGTLSGVMITDVQGDTLVVHCGQRLNSDTLVNTLRDSGCSASVVGNEPDSFF